MAEGSHYSPRARSNRGSGGGRHAAQSKASAAKAAREAQKAAQDNGIDRRFADRRAVERRAGERRSATATLPGAAPSGLVAAAPPDKVQPSSRAHKRAEKAAARQQRAGLKAAQRDAKLRRRPWLWHAFRAWTRFKTNNGTQYSAAITYFSFLALFPLLLLAAAVTGFVLHSDLHLRTELFDHITKQIPGSFGTTLKNAINSAIDARTGVGVVGLVGVLLTGLGWIGNLRLAIDAVAGLRPSKRSFLGGRVANLIVLALLGLGVVVSLGLTVAGTAITHDILRWVHVSHVQGVSYAVVAAGIVLGLLGDLLIFWWLLVWLPSLSVPGSLAFRGVLLAAIGFEVLKVVGTFTIARSSHSPTLGPFAGLLAVLIWIELVSRYLLYCVAWISTGVPDSVLARSVAGESAPPAGDEAPVGAPNAPATPLSAAAWLVGVGAAAGAAAVVSWRDRRNGSAK